MSEILKRCRWRNNANLVSGADQEKHNRRVRAALHCLLEADITVNIENYQFFKTYVKFLGSFIDEQEILADPMKTEAISQFPLPQTVKDLQRFRG